jgi:hypothetical protein
LFMKRFNLRSMEDWLHISRNRVIMNGGKTLLRHYYQNDMKKLLCRVYPEHPWNFEEVGKLNIYEYFDAPQNRRKFMNKLFTKFRLSSLEDWTLIPKSKIIENGGNRLVSMYQGSVERIVKEIYPNFPWDFSEVNLGTKPAQKKRMAEIFQSLRLHSINDWLGVSRNQMIKAGGRSLLQLYGNDMKKLLCSIFEDHQWEFGKMKFRPHVDYYHSSLEFNFKKLQRIQSLYGITTKNDWYRIPLKFDEISVRNLLKLIYPDEKWDQTLFTLKSKKTVQRILYTYIRNIYNQHFTLENYRHPLICYELLPLEFDVFVPSISLAFEYQGAQHYDDLPSLSSHLSIYQERDKKKELLSFDHLIKLIEIPYWWDQKIDSLLSVIRSKFSFVW